MAGKRSLMQQDEGIEVGYFAKRRKEFNDQIAKGIKGHKAGEQPGKTVKKTEKPEPKADDNESED